MVGEAKRLIDNYKWDCMNSGLGPVKKVNVIIIGFPPGSVETLAKYQEAKWIGGKKNDLVLCYGVYAPPEDPNTIDWSKATWAYVFGWTESEDVKQNLKEMLLNSPVDSELIPKIEEEISKNYRIKDWSKLDYVAVEPPFWSILTMFVLTVLFQSGFITWAMLNDITKDSEHAQTYLEHSTKL